MAANSICVKIDRIAFRSIFIPTHERKICADFETCPQKADFRSVDFVIDRLLMKLVRTNNVDTVSQCQQSLTLNCPV